MANNFSGLYQGGAVSFNSLPYAQLQLKQQQYNDVKQEALDNYYRDLNKGLTPAGMAANDVNDFTNKVNSWRDYVTQNRQVLDNPKDKNYGNVSSQAGYLYNDALEHAQISKAKVSDLNKFNQLRLSHPQYSITPAGMSTMQTASLPVASGYKPLDWGAVDYNPKDNPTTALDWQRWQGLGTKGLQMSKGTPTVSVDPNTKSKIVITKSSYTPDDLNTIARRYENLYQTDPKFHNEINNLMQDEGTFNDANQKFKSVYGHDLDINHPEEFATALMMPQIEKTDTHPYSYSPYSPWDYEAAREKYSDYTNTQPNNTIDDIVEDQKKTAIENSKGFYGDSNIPVDPATLKAMGVESVRYDKDNNTFIPTWREQVGTDKNGPIYETKEGTPMSEESWKAALGKRNIGSKYFQKQATTTKTTQSNTQTNSQSGYTNITETNKGKIGVKNGKWYDIQTGKPIE